MSAALMYRWDGTPERLSFEIIKKSYNAPALLRFTKRLVRALRGKPAYLIWDRLPAHRNTNIIAYLKRHRVEVVFLPGYSPNLNPTEWLWANLSGSELANLCAEDIQQAECEARRGVRRIKRRIGLLASFMRGSGLSFEF